MKTQAKLEGSNLRRWYVHTVNHGVKIVWTVTKTQAIEKVVRHGFTVKHTEPAPPSV